MSSGLTWHVWNGWLVGRLVGWNGWLAGTTWFGAPPASYQPGNSEGCLGAPLGCPCTPQNPTSRQHTAACRTSADPKATETQPRKGPPTACAIETPPPARTRSTLFMRVRSRQALPGASAATWPSMEVPAPNGTTGVRVCSRRRRRRRRRAAGVRWVQRGGQGRQRRATPNRWAPQRCGASRPRGGPAASRPHRRAPWTHRVAERQHNADLLRGFREQDKVRRLGGVVRLPAAVLLEGGGRRRRAAPHRRDERVAHAGGHPPAVRRRRRRRR
jgi:hypothetical protein